MRETAKKWAAAMIAAVLCMGMAAVNAPMQVMAAQGTETTVVVTTQRCSIWSAPATAEENRVKYVDEGYPVTIYPEVIQSESGDGKTFYRTVRGSYVLCKCVTGGDGNSSAAAGGSKAAGDSAFVIPVMPALPAFDNTASVVNWMFKPGANGSNIKYGYDALGHEIRREYYEADNTTLFMVDTLEYDPVGLWKKSMNYQPDGTILSWNDLYFYEFDEAGNQIRTTRFQPDTGMPFSADEFDAAGRRIKDTYYGGIELDGTIEEREFDAAGNCIKDTYYYADGKIKSRDVFEYDAAGHQIKWMSYHPNGAIKEYWIYEYTEAGLQLKGTHYNGNGTVMEYFIWETNAAGERIDPLPTWYNGDGTKR
ncbi:MAG: hypothetical protein K2N41_00600 [Lachnospiraceae bacterium]|nr:hypothetical protein [Lachnospiraceae bacterium]MDE7238195.1 hypothetical protein [Lachnospiraceae bacterium]